MISVGALSASSGRSGETMELSSSLRTQERQVVRIRRLDAFSSALYRRNVGSTFFSLKAWETD